MMATSGWSRPAASASAIPSMIGIFTSVSSRSKPPFCWFSASSAAAPLAAAVNSWPSSESARTTRLRMVSSSSATRIRAIGLFRSSVIRAQEAHHHVVGLDRRRRDLAAEFRPRAGLEDAQRRRRGPGIDFLSGCVAGGKAQVWYRDRLAGFAYDGALHDQCGDAVLAFLGNADLFELKMAQVDRHANGREQRRGLRQGAHHCGARADQRQVESDQAQNDRGPARRTARLLEARL